MYDMCVGVRTRMYNKMLSHYTYFLSGVGGMWGMGGGRGEVDLRLFFFFLNP